MNNLLLSMSSGMKVALYTTLSGLICSILLTIQNNYFEKHTIRFLFSFILLIAVALTSIKFWVGSAYLFYIFVLILLILVVDAPTGVVNQVLIVSLK